MGIAQFIKEIGRGANGARSLTLDQSHQLMAIVLDGQASDLEIGAFVLAMRMKGESLDELVGFLQAVQARTLQVPSEAPVVVIPSYNGARRLPNLTPLLAMLLAQEGARVLVHGQSRDPARVTSAEIFGNLGLPVVHGVEDILGVWERHEPAFVATEVLCPSLQRLLDVRWTVGLRNSGHTVAKMIDPCVGGPTLRLASYTHPEFGTLMGAWAQRELVNAMVLRGTEGECVADPRRQPRIDTWIHGQLQAECSQPAQDGVVTEMPLLPRENDAATTALYIQAVLSGEKPAPAPVGRQVQLVLRALQAMAGERPVLGKTA